MEVMEVVGRDGRGGDGSRVGSKEKRKVEETDSLLEAAPGQGPCCATAAAPACGPACGRGHVGLSLMLSPRHSAALGVAVSLGHPWVLAVIRTGHPPLLCTPQLQLGEGGDPHG